MLWPRNALSSLISFRYSLALISEEGGTTGDTYGKRKKGKYLPNTSGITDTGNS